MSSPGFLVGWFAPKLAMATGVLGLLLSAGVFAADNSGDTSPIDWDRARSLHQKEQQGDKLSPDDQTFLDRAKEMIRDGKSPGGEGRPQTRPADESNAGRPDRQRLREIYRKKQNGETISTEEQAMLDKAKTAGPQAGGRVGAALTAAGLDPQRARDLFQKSQNGGTLSTDDQAYLDKAKAVVQSLGGGQGQRGQGGQGPVPQGKPAISGQESTGLVPLTQLAGDQKYKGQTGGLYGNGSNVPPEAQLNAAKSASAKIVPLDADGKPAADGHVVLMSIGMSNTTMEFSRFKQIADEDSAKSPALTIVDAAQGGKDGVAWANVGATNTNPVWDEADRRLKAADVTPNQVQAVWIKQAMMGPAHLGDFPAHADVLQKDIEKIISLAKGRYPNLRLAYLSNRIYAGYAVTQLNPEPYSYESAFADRGVIQDQIDGKNGMSAEPVVLWGPYLWADGVKGRSGDELVFKREDLGQDGTHPSPSGRQKVADLLLKFFKEDVTARPWFAKTPGSPSASVPRQQPSPVAAAVAASNAADWSRDDAAHLLRRAGFGGTPAEIDRLHALGRAAAVEYLVSGTLPAGASAPFAHADLPELTEDLSVDYRIQGPMLFYKISELRAWWMDRMVRSDRPLEEKMSLFWHGLFCSGLREVRSVNVLAQQNKLFHREAIGNYKRLACEIIHDSAMIRYLNNDENLKGRPNENLARELMELFTMGEGNGYTEKDIPEVARALTGLTVARFGNETSYFSEAAHDGGPKTIFGKTANYTPDDVPELIFQRPEPANYLAKKLWLFYGTPDPADDDIASVADALRKSDWELSAALRTLFMSPSFYSDRCKFSIIKSPVEVDVTTLRLLEEPSMQRIIFAAAQGMRAMGQELFQPPNVKGWPGEEHWITSSTLTSRNTMVTFAATGTLGAGFGNGFAGFGGNGNGRPRPKNAPATQPAQAGSPAQLARPRFKQQPGTHTLANGKVDAETAATNARFQRIAELRQEQAEQVRAEMQKMPPVPPVDQLVVPAKLFANLPKEATPEQVVNAAAARLLQQPLAEEKKAALLQALGDQPVKLGESGSDDRVRQLLGQIMSTAEYQVE